jgi:hypothetical protein
MKSARTVAFVGSIKWQERRPFDGRDLNELIAHRTRIPGAGADTPMIAVARSGVATNGLAATYDPATLLTAWNSL